MPPGMIAVINSVIVGVFVGLLLSDLFTLPLLVCTCAGVATFLLSAGAHLRYYWKQIERREQNFPAHFPGGDERENRIHGENASSES